MALRQSALSIRLCHRKLTRLHLPSLAKFNEMDRKSNYAERINKMTKVKRNHVEDTKKGFKIIKEETVKWGIEVKRAFRGENCLWDPELGLMEHGDYEYVYKMNELEDVSKWTVTADSDLGEGNSHGEFVLGPRSTGILRGNLSQKLPKDGIIKRSGYCNIKTPSNRESFMRESSYDWSMYTHIIVRIRGDGRPAKLLLGMNRYFDIQWNDLYQYPLFTRGGPYWQVAKIPFSKFYLTSKGRIQDKQTPVERSEILWVGFTVADKVPGPFFFEIDYIAVMYDERHAEKFAYELYQTRDGVVY